MLYGPPDPFAGLRRITIADIMSATSIVHSLPRRSLVGPEHTRCIARPRQAAMYVATRRTVRSLPEIGRAFGGRDHSTVSHARDQIHHLLGFDDDVAQSVMSIDAISEMIAAERFAEMRPRLAVYR